MGIYADRKPLILEALSRSHGSGLWVKADCPFCIHRVGKEDRDHSLGFNTQSGGYICHRCGTKGYIDGKPQELPPRPTPSDVELAELRRPPEAFIPLWDRAGQTAPETREARAYLAGRRIGPDLWEAARIGYCWNGRCKGRVVVPILADDGETWMGWTARAIWKSCPKRAKYRFPLALPRGEVLYNHAALLVETSDPVYVVEGAFDELAHHPHGVATLGEVSESQIVGLLASRRPIVVVLDGDAWQKGLGIALRLRVEGISAGAVRLPPAKDPDEVDAGDLWEAARCSLTMDGPVPLL